MSLQYNGVTYNSATGTSTVDTSSWQPTTGTGSNNPNTFNSQDQKWWQSLIQAFPGILAGAAMVIQASNNQQPIIYGSGGYVQQPQPAIPGWIWLLIAAIVIGLIFFAVSGKGKKA